MIENIVIAIIVVAMIGAGIFTWWLENGPDKSTKSEDDIDVNNQSENNSNK